MDIVALSLASDCACARAQAASAIFLPASPSLFSCLKEVDSSERGREANSASAFVEQVQEFPRESLPPFAGHGDDARNHLSLVRSVVVDA